MNTIDGISLALELCARRPDRMNFAALELMIASALEEARQEKASASGWIEATKAQPAEGQEVTVRMSHGQIRQVVKDSRYSGGWKQVNCQGWECLSFDPSSVSHWRPEIFERPSTIGPTDAPWMRAAEPKAAR